LFGRFKVIRLLDPHQEAKESNNPFGEIKDTVSVAVKPEQTTSLGTSLADVIQKKKGKIDNTI
jgi:hypothetical protein